MSQQVYLCESTYEYESSRRCQMIKEANLQSFILPVWLNLYMEGLLADEKKNDLRRTFQLLDSRYIKYDITEQKCKFLAQDMKNKVRDQDQYSEIKSIIWNKFIEKQDFLKEICQEKVQQAILFIASDNMSNDLKIILSTIKQKAEERQSIYKKLFVLLRKDIIYNRQAKTAQEDDLVISLAEKANYNTGERIYNIHTDISIQQNKQLDQQEYYSKIMMGMNPQFIKKMILTFTIKDKDNFISEIISKIINQKTNSTQIIKEIQQKINKPFKYEFKDSLEWQTAKKGFALKNQEFLFKNGLQFENQHYSLAFQGGGAKGVAYVGTYKAFQQKQRNQIPLKSIMGSSAGGITALGVSTGIPYNQIQRICYSMAQIPINDRYGLNQTPEKDEYGNQITLQSIISSLRTLFRQYGILTDKIMDFFKDIPNNTIIEKLITFIQLANPTLADIFKQKLNQPIIQRHGFFKFLGGGYDVQRQVEKISLNLQGLLLHGALMKGEALHDISASCLIKYFQKEYYLSPENNQQRMKDYFILRPPQEQFGQTLATQIQTFTKNSIAILNLELNQILQILNNDQNKFLQFLVNTANKFLVMLNTYSVNKYEESIIIQNESFNKIFTINQNNLQNINKHTYDKALVGQPSDIIENSNIKYLLYPDNLTFQNLFKKVSLKQKSLRIKKKLEKYFLTYDDKKYTPQQRKNLLTKKIDQYGQGFRLMKEAMKSATTYDQINALSATYNLIDSKLLSINQKIKKQTIEKTILQFLYKLFAKVKVKKDGKQIYLLQNDEDFGNSRIHNVLKLKQSQNKDQIIFFHILEMAEEVVATLTKLKVPQNLQEGHGITLNNEKDKFFMKLEKKKLIKMMATITLKEYYAMTGIQLTCTSVDLDDKTLRLFNHKTCPKLPVCRSVQMTGSFPVAFKAQRWKKDWGNYIVYKQNRIIIFDIIGHQFTDGGLLANFPIKYLDNEEVNIRYYTHRTVKNKTILLGFGLDYMDQSKYQMSASDIKAQKKHFDLVTKAKQDLKKQIGKLNSIWNGIKLWWNTQNIFFNNEEVKWGKINSKIIDQIPLLRFLLKIITAYPNADRNFNIQSFGDQTMILDMPDINKLPTYDHAKYRQIHTQFLKQLQNRKEQSLKKINNLNLNNIDLIITYYKQDRKLMYFFLNKKKNQIIKQTFQWKNNKNIKQFKHIKPQVVEQRPLIQEQNHHNDQYFVQYNKTIIQKQLRRVRLIKQGFQYAFKQQIIKNSNQFKQIQTLLFRQQKKSYCLIQIIFNSLKMKQNKQLRDIMNNRYILHKYITFKIKDLYQNQSLQVDKINLELNKLNFKSLYFNKDYQEITKHLNFLQFKNNFYKSYLKQDQLFNKKNSINDHDQKKKIYIRPFEKNQLQQGLKQLPTKKNVHFCDPLQFDIFYSINRFIQYLYLQIKTQAIMSRGNVNKLHFDYRYERILKIHKNAKYRNPVELLQQRKQRQQRQQMLQRQQRQLYTLWYKQILQYAYKLQRVGLKSQQSIQKIQYDWYFKEYLNYINIDFEKRDENRQIQRNYQYYLKDLFNCNLYNQQQGKAKQYYNYFFDKIKRPHSQQLQLTSLQINYLQKTQFVKQLNTFLNQKTRYRQQKNPEDFLDFIFRKPQSVTASYKDQQFVRNMSYQKAQQLNNFKQNTKKNLFKLTYGQKYQNLQLPYNKQQKSLEDIHFEFVYDVEKQIQKNLRKTSHQNNQNNQYNPWNLSLKPTDLQNFASLQQIILFKLNIKSKFTFIFQLLSQNQNQLKQEQLSQQRSIYDVFYTYFKEFCVLETNIRKILYLLAKLISAQSEKKYESQFNPQNLCKKTFKLYFSLLRHLNNRFDYLVKLPINTIDLSKIDDTFMIKYQNERTIIQIFISIEKQKRLNNQSDERKSIFQSLQFTINLLRVYKFSLPLFEQDLWFIQLDQQQKRTTHNAVYDKIKANSKKNKKVHLVFEGVGNSNQYIHNYVYRLQNLKGLQQSCSQQKNINIIQEQNKSQKQINPNKKLLKNKPIIPYQNNPNPNPNPDPIQYITSSNFHSIFGMLYALGLSIEQIRSQMYQMKYLMSAMIDKEKIINYFNKGLNPNCPPNFYDDLLQHLDGQYGKSVQAFTKKSCQSSPNLNKDYSKHIEDLKDLYLQQKENLVHNYQYILNKVMNQYKDIKENNIFSSISIQVAKKYAIDFTKRYTDKYEYSLKSKQSKQKYLWIVDKLYEQYGKMLEASVGNYINNRSLLNINTKNAEVFTKGLITIRMMLTYKIKKLILKCLQRAGMPPTISLKSFHQKCIRKVFLNFTVTNVSEQRLQFLNCNSMPNMPIWAAIIACSRLPIYHTWLWGQRQWQQLSYQKAMDEKMYQFFNNYQNQNRPCTFYNTGNYISSLPIQLLTNQVLISQLFNNKDEKPIVIGLAFNPSYSSNLQQATVKKAFLSSMTLLKLYFSHKLGITKPIKQEITNKIKQYFGSQMIFNKPLVYLSIFNKPLFSQLYKYANYYSLWNKVINIFMPSSTSRNQYNTRYQHSYSIFQPIKQAMMKGPFFNTYGILANSNDNFIMKHYYSKLVKLPIKINTLDFKNVTDKDIYEKYQVLVPSFKTKQTILRSYQITKSFMNNILMRVSTEDNKTIYIENLINQRQLRLMNDEISNNRYYSTLRVECLNLPNKLTGFQQEHLKITFLNCSKWNINRYNNFCIEYAPLQNGNIPPIRSLVRSQNSQIVWKVNHASSVFIRLYYPYHGYKIQGQNYINDPENNKAIFTEFIIDCKNITNKLPAKSSFDYQFVFAEDVELSFKEYLIDKRKYQIKLKPTAMNNFPISHKERRNLPNKSYFKLMPSLILKLVRTTLEQHMIEEDISYQTFKVPSFYKFIDSDQNLND